MQMEINLPSTYNKSLKKDWTGRGRGRINVGSATHSKKKLQILMLGEHGTAAPHCLWGIRKIPKLRLKIASPIKHFAKFHDAYADLMTYLNKKIPNSNSIHGGFLTTVATCRQLPLVSSRHDQEVDSELVLENCKKLAASRRIKH